MMSLIIPVYRNEESILDLVDVIRTLNQKLKNELEAVFVVDGSPDGCFELLQKTLPSQKFRSKVILLSRNFGAFMAIRTGLQFSTGKYFAVMAADLQEPPELVLEMAHILKNEPVDVVVGARENRADPILSRITSRIFWNFYRRYVVPEIPPGGVDIFACNQIFRDKLLTLDERHSSLIAQIFWLGFRRKCISYIRQKRQHGKSAWTFRKKMHYMMDSVFSFTDLPIRLLIKIGAGGSIVAGIFGIVIIIAKMYDMIKVPGYTMIMLTIIFSGCCNLLALGIVGSYAWRTYENTKNRPLSVSMQVDSFGVTNE